MTKITRSLFDALRDDSAMLRDLSRSFSIHLIYRTMCVMDGDVLLASHVYRELDA